VAGPTDRQSAEFLQKAEEFVPMLGIEPKGDGANSVSLKFPNGSRIIGLPGESGDGAGVFESIDADDRGAGGDGA